MTDLPALRVHLKEVGVLVLAAEVAVDIVLDDFAVAELGDALALEAVVLGERAVVQDAARMRVERRADGVHGGARGRRGYLRPYRSV